MAATLEQLKRWANDLNRLSVEMESAWPQGEGVFDHEMVALTHCAWLAVVREEDALRHRSGLHPSGAAS